MSWHPIQPLDPAVEEQLRGDLAAAGALHRQWLDFTAVLDEADKRELRRRTLRKQAIETGILERLYDLDWGLTRALVAEGLTKEAVFRAGGDVPDGVLSTLQAQMNGLQLVIDFVKEDRPLSPFFIKELHELITQTQKTYDATDTLGNPVQPPLRHGDFKKTTNNVIRSDGSLLEFAPPEQVDSEMENLVNLYNKMIDNVHPIVSAAWLHHRFVLIHPFEDGNGRVARALALLSLERDHYPPIVVSRNDRDRYLRALEVANDGDLTHFGQLFAKLAMRSIRNELQEPAPISSPKPQTAKEVARAFAKSWDQKERQQAEQKAVGVHIRAEEMHARIEDWLKVASHDLENIFKEHKRRVKTNAEEMKRDRSPKWRREIIRTAQHADYYADLTSDKWWQMLQVDINGFRMKFVVSIHHVGSLRTGVMAITSFGLIQHRTPRARGEGYSTAEDFVETSWDAFTFSHDEEVENRAGELNDWLDYSLAVAVQELSHWVVGRGNGLTAT